MPVRITAGRYKSRVKIIYPPPGRGNAVGVVREATFIVRWGREEWMRIRNSASDLAATAARYGVTPEELRAAIDQMRPWGRPPRARAEAAQG